MENAPEKWRPLEAWPKSYLAGRYEISDRGRIRRTAFGEGREPPGIVATGRNSSGRRVVVLQSTYRKKSGRLVTKNFRHLVHLLVYDTFVGPRAKGLEVTHLDWDRDNNAVENLALATHAEIMERAARDGRLPWLYPHRATAL